MNFVHRPDRLDPRDHRSGARAGGQKLALALLVALGVAAVRTTPQDAPKPQTDEPKPSASEILARAIAAQGLPPVKDAAADLPIALRTKVNLQFTSKEGDVVNVDAERRYLGSKDGPGYVWTRAASTSNPKEESILAFDGKRGWLWSRQAAAVRWLDQPGGEQDRAQLEDDLHTTALLARAFLLRNLPSQWRDVKRLTPDAARDGLTAWRIQGVADVERDGVKKPVVLQLYIEQEKAWLYGARVEVEGEAPVQLCFTKHETKNGVVVPGKIEIYVDKEPKPRQTLYVIEFDLAPKLEPKDFAAPSK